MGGEQQLIVRASQRVLCLLSYIKEDAVKDAVHSLKDISCEGDAYGLRRSETTLGKHRGQTGNGIVSFQSKELVLKHDL